MKYRHHYEAFIREYPYTRLGYARDMISDITALERLNKRTLDSLAQLDSLLLEVENILYGARQHIIESTKERQ